MTCTAQTGRSPPLCRPLLLDPGLVLVHCNARLQPQRQEGTKKGQHFPLTDQAAFFVSPPPSPSRLESAAPRRYPSIVRRACCCCCCPLLHPSPTACITPPLQRSMSHRTSGPSTTTHLGIGQQEFNPSPASTRPHHYPLLRHAGTDEQEHRVCLSVPSTPHPPPSLTPLRPWWQLSQGLRFWRHRRSRAWNRTGALPACVCSPTGASQLFLHLTLRVCAGLPTRSSLACLVPPFSRPGPGLAPCCPSLFSILDNRRPDRRRGLTPSPTQTSATILDWPVAALPCLFSLGPLARLA